MGTGSPPGLPALPLPLLLPGGIAVVPVDVPQIQTCSAVTFSVTGKVLPISAYPTRNLGD